MRNRIVSWLIYRWCIIPKFKKGIVSHVTMRYILDNSLNQPSTPASQEENGPLIAYSVGEDFLVPVICLSLGSDGWWSCFFFCWSCVIQTDLYVLDLHHGILATGIILVYLISRYSKDPGAFSVDHVDHDHVLHVSSTSPMCNTDHGWPRRYASGGLILKAFLVLQSGWERLPSGTRVLSTEALRCQVGM